MRVVIFDFDGTLTAGDDSALRYAGEVSEEIPVPERAAYEHDITLDFQATGPDRWPGAADGFDAVRRRAMEHRVDPEALNRAYLRSRKAMASGDVAIVAPIGLAEFLDMLPARRVVVTNSPDLGLDQALTRMGIANSIDEVHVSVGKPQGFTPIIERLCDEVGPRNILAIGDIWVNDLLPAHALGCATALITHGRASNRRATYVCDELPDLYAPVMRWAGEGPTDCPLNDKAMIG